MIISKAEMLEFIGHLNDCAVFELQEVDIKDTNDSVPVGGFLGEVIVSQSRTFRLSIEGTDYRILSAKFQRTYENPDGSLTNIKDVTPTPLIK